MGGFRVTVMYCTYCWSADSRPFHCSSSSSGPCCLYHPRYYWFSDSPECHHMIIGGESKKKNHIQIRIICCAVVNIP